MTTSLTKDLLALYDKYDGDLGLLDERWADKNDHGKFTNEQMRIFGQYIRNLMLIRNVHYSDKLKGKAIGEIIATEKIMDAEVAYELKRRLGIL
jgi:hypothetical protein